MNSTLLSSLPWHTGVIRDYRQFSGSILVDKSMEVSSFNSYSKPLCDWFLKEFLSVVDRYEGHLFSSRSFTRPQDHLLQQMMGIDVRVEEGVEIVGPCQNCLSSGRLVPALATRIFTALCGYRLVDIIAFLGGTYPSATVVERSLAPTGTLQACIFFFFCIARISFLA